MPAVVMMNLSAKARRILRAAPEHEEVFVFGETVREELTAPAIATAGEMITSAATTADGMVDEARRQAGAILAEARASVNAVRDAAYSEGFESGRAAALQEMNGILEFVRRAATEAKAIRDDIAGQSPAIVARAAALATRRIVGEYYESDPERTAIVCAEALRAASGQEILSIRVNPGLVGHVQASLLDAARYVVPDTAVAVGGCVVDLRNGTLDATLDARLALMDFALAEAGGEARA